jgi:hypothetical protein
MKRSNNHRTVCSLVLAALLGLGFLSTLAATGCDTSGYYDYSGYIQDAYDYQQSVYDWANQQWDDYIRM